MAVEDSVVEEFKTFPGDSNNSDNTKEEEDLEPEGEFRVAILVRVELEELSGKGSRENTGKEVNDFVIIRIIGKNKDLAVPVKVDTENHGDDEKNFIGEDERGAEFELDQLEEVWSIRQRNSCEVTQGLRPDRRNSNPADEHKNAGKGDESLDDVVDKLETLHGIILSYFVKG